LTPASLEGAEVLRRARREKTRPDLGAYQDPAVFASRYAEGRKRVFFSGGADGGRIGVVG
ncbi:MAG TPA: hypothetical protein PKN85_00350, partial [Syntrophorhabdaceae bacterium]|nr:hypothetical protein [Syntrophorhabdaceae bacterium]